MHRAIDHGTARELAVKAQVDPRTIIAVLRGRRVRGMAGQRAREALVAAGLLPAEPRGPRSS